MNSKYRGLSIRDGLCKGGRASLLWPGFGHVLQARFQGLLFMVAVPACYWIHPVFGFCLHMACVLDAWWFGYALRAKIDSARYPVPGYNC